MKSLSVGVYGETCSGKSTLGKHLSSKLACKYISFGDLKRKEIACGTKVGLKIKRSLDFKYPLPAELGYTVIRNAIKDGLNIVSGYPISVDEFRVFSNYTLMIGILILGVNEKTLIQRFSLRRKCSECYMPGIIGDLCPIHKIPMVQREDMSLEELITRRKLYRQRITPFLKSKDIKILPRLLLNSSTFTKDDLICRTEEWINGLLTKNGGIQ